MRAIKYKIIGLFLAIILFCSGIYFDNTEIDSPFTYVPIENTSSCIELSHLTISDGHVCTTGMLGIRNTSSIKQSTVRFFSYKKATHNLIDCLYSYILSLQEGNLFMCFEDALINSKCSDKLITIYIHNSDGKKRI